MLKEELLDWNTEALAESQFTPDCEELFKRDFWLLFNYNLFQFEYGAAIGFTDHKFRVWKQDIGSMLPHLVALEAQPDDVASHDIPPWADPFNAGAYQRTPTARVRGILEILPSTEYLKIDTIMQNGIMFIRKRVDILIPQHTIMRVNEEFKLSSFRSEMTVIPMKVWMYVGSPQYFNNDETSVDAGYLFKPAKLTQPKSFWIGDFYTC